jgi:hypothetical protein
MQGAEKFVEFIESNCPLFEKSESAFQQLVSWASLAYDNKMPEAMTFVGKGYGHLLGISGTLLEPHYYFQDDYFQDKVSANSGACIELFDRQTVGVLELFNKKILIQLEWLHQRKPHASLALTLGRHYPRVVGDDEKGVIYLEDAYHRGLKNYIVLFDLYQYYMQLAMKTTDDGLKQKYQAKVKQYVQELQNDAQFKQLMQQQLHDDAKFKQLMQLLRTYDP